MVVTKTVGMLFAIAMLFVSTDSYAGGRLFGWCGGQSHCVQQSSCCEQRVRYRIVRHRHSCCDQQQYYAPVSSCCGSAPVVTNPGNPPTPPVTPAPAPAPEGLAPAPAPAPAPQN